MQNVIIRITTLPTLPVFSSSMFPIAEPRKAIADELQVSIEQVQRKQQKFTEWIYYGRDREKRLAIAPSWIFASYSRYTAFEDLKVDFFTVLEPLFRGYPDLRGGRLGLRYVNSIEPAGHDPFQWEALIDHRVLGLFTRFAGQRQ